MKTHKRLWESFISAENFELASIKAVKSKKSKTSVQYFLENKEFLLKQLRNTIIAGKYQTTPYEIFTIYEPKKRVIYKLPLYPDHIVHHALINILGPIWQKSFIADTYACIPGKGLHSASKRTMQFVRRNKYVLQCDIRKFYPSINHDIMMRILSKKINDTRLLKILGNIVYSIDGETNIPIGNLTSQWFGNVFLNELDQFVKMKLRWPDYIRYCDDFCLYGNDKHKLREMGQQIEQFINNELLLSFSKCEVRQTKGGVTFIGYRHFKKCILLRKTTAKKIMKRLKNIIRHNDYSDFAIGQLGAAYGWLKHACSYNYRQYICRVAKQTSNKMYWFIKNALRM